MRKTIKLLSPESFEAVSRNWEQDIKEFIFQLSDGSIPTLRNAEWIVKNRVFLYVIQIWMERKNVSEAGHFIVRLHH